jgi:hypothetical protein
VLRLIEPSELVASFVELPDEEQAWRGRLFLAMLWLTHDIPMSWWYALADEASLPSDYRAMMTAFPDELIVTRVHGLRAGQALETGVGLAEA